jgi:hypothetical protein
MKQVKLTMKNDATAQEQQEVIFFLKTTPPNVGFIKEKML